jgi:transposase
MPLITAEINPDADSIRPFRLMREHALPALETHRDVLRAMYDPSMGRPETDPVTLMAATTLQVMQRIPDRACADVCRYDARWNYALGGIACFHPTTLTHFRARLMQNNNAKLALDSCLRSMRDAGFLRRCKAVRIDSTHLLANIARLSRLECVRETLRLALLFLAEFGGGEEWEPWHTRYMGQNPGELRNASPKRLASCMDAAGADIRDILAKTDALGHAVADAKPIALLRRVFGEQFDLRDNTPLQRRAAPSGAVVNPHDREAQWSTKTTLGKTGWQGYKAQVCETVHDEKRAPGEPTASVITAIRVQDATASDHGSITETLRRHAASNGSELPEEVIADAGYVSAPALIKAASDGYELIGPVPSPPYSGKRLGSDSFDVDLPNRTARCPAGHPSSECSKIDDTKYGTRYFFMWPAQTCVACPLREKCLSAKPRRQRRSLEVGGHHTLVQERRRLCKTDAYRKRYKRRAAIEGTHSELTRGYGFRRCRYRGLGRTQLQASFTAAACNLRRWAARSCWEERRKT